MPSFINIDTEKAINRKYLLHHLYFLFLWILIFGIIFFRIDSHIVNSLIPEQGWILYLTPVLLIAILFFSLRELKWYFKLAFFLYIPLLIFWFVPKLVLQKGKFYLFISYVNTIISRIKKWRSTLLHTLLFTTIAILLSNVSHISVRVISIVTVLYVLVKYNYRYAVNSFNPEGLLGSRTIKFLTSEKRTHQKSIDQRFDNFEQMMRRVEKDDLTKEEIKEKQLSQLVAFYAVFDSLKASLTSSKNTLSFVLYWVMTFIFSAFFTALLIAFINYQLFQIDPSSFIVEGEVGFWEFIRYTGKCLTYGDIEEIRPISGLAKIIEGATFFIVGIIYFMIFVSFGFSYKASRVEEEKKVVIEVLDRQLSDVNEFASHKFGKEYQEILNEFSEIGESVNKIKKAFERMI